MSGQVAYVESAGDKNQFLHLIVILSGHPVAGFDEVYLDGKLIGEFGSKAYYELFTGNQPLVCQSLIDASAGRWTANHKLLGCAYIYLKLEYDESLFTSGIPTVQVVTRGKNDIYDTRSGIFGWSDNPALCARDYMVLPEALGGMGCEEGDATRAERLTWYESNSPVYADLYKRIWGMA
ncbi:hypothetical protein [Geomobilimonas luticola]|uniref:Uncharacterized protein n=1 Tax=Geomobilimonas luticola TaxID=1114878 RepID=A0ABS5SG55_9BACT|nr:hypothetical protein [Geomobilimonas luticola]MBT0654349.1 hypothetical protein [Geomobilimonas luticola]